MAALYLPNFALTISTPEKDLLYFLVLAKKKKKKIPMKADWPGLTFGLMQYI